MTGTSTKNDATDLVGSSTSTSLRRASGPKAGSVWETRMKLDEVKGGFKVFTPSPQENTNSPNTPPISPLKTNSELSNNMVKSKQGQSPVWKRKTWKSENSQGSPVQIARQSKNSDEQSKDLIFSSDGIKKSPAQIKKTRSNGGIQLRKVKSESLDERRSVEGNLELRKMKSEIVVNRNLDEELKKDSAISLELVSVDENVKNCDEKIKKSRSDEEFGVCEEKAMTSVLGNVGQTKPPSDDDDDKNLDDEEEEEEEIEVEVEKKSVEVKEIKIQEQKPKKIVVEEKKLLQNNERPVPSPTIARKQAPPLVNHAKIHSIPAKTKPVSDYFNGATPRTHSKLQSFVDLIMWKDVSKSAFVFGIGTFLIISSSYSKDFNISFISVISYLGLVYLAAIFLLRSLINRGPISMDKNQDYVVGEEEAIWLIKLFLPYINEFLLKLRALFSGDPATTMKLAVLLFILARCGNSITIWKMAKLGFFGVFIVPKVCSSYSSNLAAFGTFWIRRFRDAWASCSHKKAVGFAIFTLIWNLSSVVARIWAVFMLFVGFKYYQQSLVREEWAQQEGPNNQTGQSINIGGKRPAGRGPTLTNTSNKQKKVS